MIYELYWWFNGVKKEKNEYLKTYNMSGQEKTNNTPKMAENN